MRKSNLIKFNSLDIATIGICSAILFIVQVVFAFLPNIELVSLFIIIFTIHLRWKTLYSIYIFAIVEGVLYGFSIWFISYLYVWTILFFIVLLLSKKTDNLFIFSIISSIFGLAFGTLTSIPYFFIGGLSAVIAYIVSGIPFDLIHCVSNFLIGIMLFKPLNLCFEKIMKSKK